MNPSVGNIYEFIVSNYLFERDTRFKSGIVPKSFTAKLVEISPKGFKVDYTQNIDNKAVHTEFWLPRSQCNIGPIDDHPASNQGLEAPKCVNCEYYQLICQLRYVLENPEDRGE
jgi:hypothetical protein